MCTRVLLERRCVVPLLFGVSKDDPARVTEKRRHVSEQITNINQSLTRCINEGIVLSRIET